MPRARLMILCGVLLLWICALIFIALCATDIIFIHVGRERWFALCINVAFLIATVALFVRFRRCFALYPSFTTAIPLCFLAILLITGLWTPIIASITGPPWADRIVKIPFSAATPYMVDLWAWNSGPEEK